MASNQFRTVLTQELKDELLKQATFMGLERGQPGFSAFMLRGVMEALQLQWHQIEMEEAKEDAERQREHELAVIRARAEADSRNSTPTPTETTPSYPPHPPFRPGSESLDHFLSSYENYGSLVRKTPEQMAIELTALLPYDLRLVLECLSSADRSDFSRVKATLLRSAAFTPKVCRQRFKEAAPLPGDTVRSFLQRKHKYLQDWLDVAKVPDDQLKQFMVVEDFLHHAPPSLTAYVVEKETHNYEVEKIADTADRFLEIHCQGQSLKNYLHSQRARSSHPVRNGSSSSSSSSPSSSSQHRHTPSHPPSTHKHGSTHMQQSSGGQTQAKPMSPSEKGTTFYSKPMPPKYSTYRNSRSHSTEECHGWGLGYRQSIYASQNPPMSQGLGSPSKHINPRDTYTLDHHSVLPAPPKDNLNSNFSSNPNHITSPLDLVPNSVQDTNAVRDLTDIPPSSSSARLAAMTVDDGATLNTCRGTLNGEPVTILLDSGAEGIFVDRAYVSDSQLTGDMVHVRLPEGPPVNRPLCRIQLDCPYYKGTHLAVALNSPAQSVYLGQIQGCKPFPGTSAALEEEAVLATHLPKAPEEITTPGPLPDSCPETPCNVSQLETAPPVQTPTSNYRQSNLAVSQPSSTGGFANQDPSYTNGGVPTMSADYGHNKGYSSMDINVSLPKDLGGITEETPVSDHVFQERINQKEFTTPLAGDLPNQVARDDATDKLAKVGDIGPDVTLLNTQLSATTATSPSITSTLTTGSAPASMQQGVSYIVKKVSDHKLPNQSTLKNTKPTTSNARMTFDKDTEVELVSKPVFSLSTSPPELVVTYTGQGPGIFNTSMIPDKPIQPSPPDPAKIKLSKEQLVPNTPPVTLDTKKLSFSPHMQEFCLQHPVAVGRGIASALKLHLQVFSPKTWIADNPEQTVEVRKQMKQDTKENIEPQPKADDSKKKKVNGMTKLAINVDPHDEKKCQPQLTELIKLPAFVRVVSAGNILSPVDQSILGTNTVQPYMKVSGSRTPDHHENNSLCSITIKFTLSTGHRPLLHLQTAEKLYPKLQRWALYLNLFRYHSQHITGECNHLADLLSRSGPF